MDILIRLLISGLAVYVTGRIFPGVVLTDFLTAIVVSIVLGVVNAFIKPILVILTLPVNIITLGLFMFIINACMILLVSSLVPGFTVDGFVTALLFSLILSVVSAVLHSFTK